MRSSFALAAALSATFVLPATAVASTVGFEDGTVVFRSGSRTSDMTLSQPVFGHAGVHGRAPVAAAGAGCTSGAPVLCANPEFAPHADPRSAGDDDRVRAFSFASRCP